MVHLKFLIRNIELWFPVRHEVEEREVKARMDRPHVKVVEEMGVRRDLVMTCIRKRLHETGMYHMPKF